VQQEVLCKLGRRFSNAPTIAVNRNEFKNFQNLISKMENKDFNIMTNDELLVERKKMRQSKELSALAIGFLLGILAVGTVSFIISSKKNIGFIVAMLPVIYIIYKQIKKPNQFKELEKVLKERKLN
jgi:hypothetical protein